MDRHLHFVLIWLVVAFLILLPVLNLFVTGNSMEETSAGHLRDLLYLTIGGLIGMASGSVPK